VLVVMDSYRQSLVAIALSVAEVAEVEAAHVVDQLPAVPSVDQVAVAQVLHIQALLQLRLFREQLIPEAAVVVESE
jgi:hypothetical protein